MHQVTIMKKLMIALFSVTLLSGAVPSADQEKEVMAAMDSWIQATVKQDVPALQKILHDELWYSHSAGTSQTKAEVIKDIQEGRGPIGIELSDTRVRIYGNAAHGAFESIIQVAREHKVPVFSPSPFEILKGATAALYPDFQEGGVEAGKMIARILKGESPGAIPFFRLQTTKEQVSKSATDGK